MNLNKKAIVTWCIAANVATMLVSELPQATAQMTLPGGTLHPGDVDKYQTTMLIPPVMPIAGKIQQKGGRNLDYYEISMKQFPQQILPAEFNATTVWGYGPEPGSRNGVYIHNAPSLTIEAKFNEPVRIKWINDLKDADGNCLPHLLPVDQTLHWANPPGGDAARDTRPVFTDTPGVYEGPVPIVTHVHGAVGVGDESDGYPEAWYLPDCTVPEGYATEGTWYDFFAGKAKAKFGATWGKGYATFQYPNEDRASTNWYHDHTLGMTRQNVYAGPAGFFIIRGGPDGDDAVRDSRTGAKAKLPGPAPKPNDRFPPNKTYFEIPIVIQDRSFNEDGSLFYPDSRVFFDGIAGPYIPDSDISPQWNPEFFGNMIIVNGRTWPFQVVEQRRYRLRFLNGCQSRFLILDFDDIVDVQVTAIGNEGGFLKEPVDITGSNSNQLLMGPAERYDLIVDFTNVPVGRHVLHNVGPDEPFGGGVPGMDFMPADPESTGQIMEFRVVATVGADPTTPAKFLQLPATAPLPDANKVRPLALLEQLSEFFPDAPAEILLGNFPDATQPNKWMKRLWSVSDKDMENPAAGSIEVWELYNGSVDAHPIHVHEVIFEVVNRQKIIVNEDAMTVELIPNTERPPEPWETGFKDTVIVYPGEVTRIKAKFEKPGQYVWHCHILEHEDNEMMLPYRVGPIQDGQPLRG